MFRISAFFIIFVSFLYSSDDYSFDFEAIEIKPYKFTGYIKADHKKQKLNQSSLLYQSKNSDFIDSYYFESALNYEYYYNDYSFFGDVLAMYESIDSSETNDFLINQLYIKYKFNNSHHINIGKRSPKWGKGYYANPIAFIDRKKDPNDPEATKEGFVQLNYKYNKVFDSDLQNISFDLVFIKTSSSQNEYLYNDNSNIIALKSYFLYKDVDIDVAYLYSNKSENKFGIDFSTNLETNFEIHGEVARFDNSFYSYLVGLKYLTNSDLTIISEYLYQNMEQKNDTPFWDNRYFVNSFNQKEPFDILYSTLYYKNILNLEDNSYQNRLGVSYSGFENIDIDFSISKNIGKQNNEFGKKSIDSATWLQLKYSF
jgi:hypothetical protein